MNQAETDVFADSVMTFSGHVQELIRCVVTFCGLPLAAAVACFPFADNIASFFCLVADPWAKAAMEVHESTVAGRILWSVFLAGGVFHYAFLHQAWKFVSAGLYPDEQRLAAVPLFWTCLIPGIVLGISALFSLAARVLGADVLTDAGSILAWLIRFYLLTALATLLLSLPRRTRSLNPIAFLGVLGFVYFLPNHVFETLLISLAELWALGLIVGLLTLMSMAK
jgi:hypothetical protein